MFMELILDWQKAFHDGLTSALKQASLPDGGWALLMLLAFSFLYGVFHTLLPGHQKTVLGAYFASENARWVQGWLAGILFAIFHALTAILALWIVRWGLEMTAGGSLSLIHI
jgi:nickel/cobalt exporter